jgi:hypothetical protein
MDCVLAKSACAKIAMNERALVGFKLLLLVRIRSTVTVRIGTVCLPCRNYALDIAWHVNQSQIMRPCSQHFFFWKRNLNILFNHLRDTHELSRLQTLNLYGVALFVVQKFYERNDTRTELNY